MAQIDIDEGLLQAVREALPEDSRHQVHELVNRLLEDWLRRNRKRRRAPADEQQPSTSTSEEVMRKQAKRAAGELLADIRRRREHG